MMRTAAARTTKAAVRITKAAATTTTTAARTTTITAARTMTIAGAMTTMTTTAARTTTTNESQTTAVWRWRLIGSTGPTRVYDDEGGFSATRDSPQRQIPPIGHTTIENMYRPTKTQSGRADDN